ncbi:MAG: FAD-dependent oxidoreductase [Ardenticatenales bacterium]|nr:FAD-dependent oxidoreductase [Ardenticatenales bacterium]
MSTPRTVIIGAGIAGLTAAALLAKAGHEVTVLEAHVDPGGCAATFFYKEYHFDAGATLVGGFQPGGPHDVVAQRLAMSWPVKRAEPALCFHSPDGSLTRWGDAAAWRAERLRAFGGRAERFWRSQEQVAAQLWRFAASLAPWPPGNVQEFVRLSSHLLRQPTLATLSPLLFSSVQGWMKAFGAGGALLQQFVDAQLLISAQAAAPACMALFGAVALDLPRAGVFHVRGGVGGIAEALAKQVHALGGKILYKAEVTRLEATAGRVRRVHTRKKGSFEADVVVANLTPWDIAALLGEDAPAKMQQRVQQLPPMWGAFMLYLGVDEEAIPPGLPAHHQFLQQPGLPPGEGNSVFLSISPSWDTGRAPPGQRTLTLSTHTRVAPWWALYQTGGGQDDYEARVARYSESLLRPAEQLLPALRSHIRLQLPATPVTFERFTHRHRGYVGGFPQHSLFATLHPRLPVGGLWMVGDSIFPGQSTAGVTLGALRVAQAILGESPVMESTGQSVSQVH